MNGSLLAVFTVVGLILAMGGWLIWQLLRQNGRILLRLDELEKRLDESEFAEELQADTSTDSRTTDQVDSRPHPGPLPEGEGENGDGAKRFGNRSLARSKIKRDGLKAGTPAPDFRLPCLDGGELELKELRGKRVLLVFSDPHCGPCNTLAPELQKFHREQVREVRPPSPLPSPPGEGEPTRGPVVLMISRGDPKENRTKVKEHSLTFPIVLQQRWEISRRYAMFATPVAYLIDEAGIIAHDPAVGVEPILALLVKAADFARESIAN